MGKLNIFEITLAKPVYTGGETLQGHVTVELNDEMKMRGIRLQFTGQANVHWSERHTSGSGKNRTTTTRHYRSSEGYFNFVVVLLGKAQGIGGPDPVLPAGRYVYPFTYNLPPNLPSSFEGAHGRVRYWLDGVIDKPWKFDHHTKRAFSILSVLDLNIQSAVRDPQNGSGSKTLCCLCCESGPISATFRIDRRGYVPGECIVLDGEVDNKSDRTMSHTSVEFRMYTTFRAKYRATTKSRTSVTKVAELVRGKLEAGQTEVWSGQRVHIPPLPPSVLINCNIIHIVYHVVLVVDPSGPAFDLEVPLEILVGTIPLTNVQSYFSTSAFAPPPQYNPNWGADPNAPIQQQPQPTAPPENVLSGIYDNKMSDLPPPPSYAEYAMGKGNIQDEGDNEHTRGDRQWAPVYTYYSFGEGGNNPPPAQPH